MGRKFRPLHPGFLLVTFVLLATNGAPAVAQSQSEKATGSHIRRPKRAYIPDGTLTSVDKARVTQAEFARCTLDRHRQRVFAALALEPGYDGKALIAATPGDCLGEGSLRTDTVLLRGALFAELYRRRVSASEDDGLLFPVLPLDLSRQLPDDAPLELRSSQFLLLITDCVHEADPEAVRAVITSDVASAEQEKAFATVIPLLGPCVPTGQTLRLSKSMLEAAFGEYLYRSSAPAGANGDLTQTGRAFGQP